MKPWRRKKQRLSQREIKRTDILNGIQNLSLAHENWGDEKISLLVKSLENHPRLEKIDFSYNDLKNPQLKRLKTLPRLEWLSLEGNQITEKKRVGLVKIIKESPRLQSLILFNNQLTDRMAISLIAAAAKSSCLRVLDLNANPIREEKTFEKARLIQKQLEKRCYLVISIDNFYQQSDYYWHILNEMYFFPPVLNHLIIDYLGELSYPLKFLEVPYLFTKKIWNDLGEVQIANFTLSFMHQRFTNDGSAAFYYSQLKESLKKTCPELRYELSPLKTGDNSTNILLACPVIELSKLSRYQNQIFKDITSDLLEFFNAFIENNEPIARTRDEPKVRNNETTLEAISWSQAGIQIKILISEKLQARQLFAALNQAIFKDVGIFVEGPERNINEASTYYLNILLKEKFVGIYDMFSKNSSKDSEKTTEFFEFLTFWKESYTKSLSASLPFRIKDLTFHRKSEQGTPFSMRFFHIRILFEKTWDYDIFKMIARVIFEDIEKLNKFIDPAPNILAIRCWQVAYLALKENFFSTFYDLTLISADELRRIVRNMQFEYSPLNLSTFQDEVKPVNFKILISANRMDHYIRCLQARFSGSNLPTGNDDFKPINFNPVISARQLKEFERLTLQPWVITPKGIKMMLPFLQTPLVFDWGFALNRFLELVHFEDKGNIFKKKALEISATQIQTLLSEPELFETIQNRLASCLFPPIFELVCLGLQWRFIKIENNKRTMITLESISGETPLINKIYKKLKMIFHIFSLDKDGSKISTYRSQIRIQISLKKMIIFLKFLYFIANMINSHVLEFLHQASGKTWYQRLLSDFDLEFKTKFSINTGFKRIHTQIPEDSINLFKDDILKNIPKCCFRYHPDQKIILGIKWADLFVINLNFISKRYKLIENLRHDLKNLTGLDLYAQPCENANDCLLFGLSSEKLSQYESVVIHYKQMLESHFQKCQFANKVSITGLKLIFALSYAQIHDYIEYLEFSADDFGQARLLKSIIEGETDQSSPKLNSFLSGPSPDIDSKVSSDEKEILDKFSPRFSQITGLEWKYDHNPYWWGYQLAPRRLEARMEVVQLLEFACALFSCRYLPIILLPKDDKHHCLPAIYFISKITEAQMEKFYKVFDFFKADKKKIAAQNSEYSKNMYILIPDIGSIFGDSTKEDVIEEKKLSISNI